MELVIVIRYLIVSSGTFSLSTTAPSTGSLTHMMVNADIQIHNEFQCSRTKTGKMLLAAIWRRPINFKRIVSQMRGLKHLGHMIRYSSIAMDEKDQLN